MIEGIPVIDVHMHAAARATLKVPWEDWCPAFASGLGVDALYRDDGTVDPASFHAHLDEQGVDYALLMAEYSPKVTGTQSVEDLLALVAHDPTRVGFIGSINPHLHWPVVAELDRQRELGARAIKLHPVHQGFDVATRELFPLYASCEERGVPIVVHAGTSNFAGAMNRFADPTTIDDVARTFPGLTILLAHGGRGWWYDAAAFLVRAHANVWIELSGLPPHRLDHYYGAALHRLTDRMVFGTDWPAIPGVGKNIAGLRGHGFDDVVLADLLWRNAVTAYRLEDIASERGWQ